MRRILCRADIVHPVFLKLIRPFVTLTQYSSNVKRCTYKGKLMLRKSFSNLYAPYKYSQSKEELDTRTTYYGVILIIGA